jgi:hypothetical protein
MGNWLAALHECSDILGRPFRDVSHRLLFARAICCEAPKVGHAGDEAFALAIEDCPVPDPGHASLSLFQAAESKSDSLERFPGSRVPPPTSRGLKRFHVQKNGLGGGLTICK